VVGAFGESFKKTCLLRSVPQKHYNKYTCLEQAFYFSDLQEWVIIYYFSISGYRKRKADKLFENRCIICTHRWKAISSAPSAFTPRLGTPRDVSAASEITKSMEPEEPARRWPPPRPISPMPRIRGESSK